MGYGDQHYTRFEVEDEVVDSASGVAVLIPNGTPVYLGTGRYVSTGNTVFVDDGRVSVSVTLEPVTF